METLYTRAGNEFTGTPSTDDKGKPVYHYAEPCSRCGGAGGSSAWRFTGWTCYQCDGKNSMNFHSRTEKLYTAEQLEKMNASLKARQEKAATKKAAEAVEKAKQIEESRVQIFEALPVELRAAIEWGLSLPEEGHREGIAQDIAVRFNKKLTPLSEKQVSYILSRHAEFLKKQAEQALVVACPEGRVEITGEVVSTRSEEIPVNKWRTVYAVKMLVKDDRGFKVWGNAPDSLLGGAELKGERVSFTATVQPSEKDEFFGFFSRPAKAQILEA